MIYYLIIMCSVIGMAEGLFFWGYQSLLNLLKQDLTPFIRSLTSSDRKVGIFERSNSISGTYIVGKYPLIGFEKSSDRKVGV